MISLLLVLYLVILTLLTAIGSLFLKKGAKGFNFDIGRQARNWNLILGSLLFGLGVIGYLYALKQGSLSEVYPITSVTYVWVSILSVMFLNEKMNFKRWAGIVLIIIGIVLIAAFS